MKEIERVNRGEKVVDGALTYNMIESIIHMILKNTEYMKFAVPVFSTVAWKTRGKVIEKMEKLLSVWMQDQHQH